jgi:hypothetical protein
VKMKPPEVALLALLSFRIVLQRLRWFVLQGAQCFQGSSPNSKSLCRWPRKTEGCLLQLMLRHAQHVVPRPGFFSLVVGRTKF